MQRVRNGLTLATAADDKSKALSDRGHEATGAAPVNVPGYQKPVNDNVPGYQNSVNVPGYQK